LSHGRTYVRVCVVGHTSERMFVCDIRHTTGAVPRVGVAGLYVYVFCLDSLFWGVVGVVVGGLRSI
jgi:hypothetical protein